MSDPRIAAVMDWFANPYHFGYPTRSFNYAVPQADDTYATVAVRLETRRGADLPWEAAQATFQLAHLAGGPACAADRSGAGGDFAGRRGGDHSPDGPVAGGSGRLTPTPADTGVSAGDATGKDRMMSTREYRPGSTATARHCVGCVGHSE